jgi:hypothetical protein
MENDKLVDIILKRLDILESKIDANRVMAEQRAEIMGREIKEINQKLWFFAGIWAVIGGVVAAFGKKILESLFGAA